MSYCEAWNVTSYRPPATPQAAGVQYVSDGKLDLTPDQMLEGDVIGLCVLPADCIPIDFMLVCDDLDESTNLKVSVGVLNEDKDDLDEEDHDLLIEESTVAQAGGTAQMEGVVITTPEPVDRIIAARIDTGAVFAESSTGSVTIGSDNASAADTVTIDEKTYTFVAENPTTEGDVLVGDTAEASAENLFAAINRVDPDENDGVMYAIAAAHPTVQAVSVDEDGESAGDFNISLEVIEPGTDGDEIDLAKSGDYITVSGAKFADGVDAEPFKEGAVRGVLYYRAAEYGA
jgi:hypothetical protein